MRRDYQARTDVLIEVVHSGRSPEQSKIVKGFGPIAISMARGNTPDSASVVRNIQARRTNDREQLIEPARIVRIYRH